MSEENDTLQIDDDLVDRLKALASRSGRSYTELAESVLRAHADEEERKVLEYADDEERWQRYLSGGHAVPLETVRDKLHKMAVNAARRSDPR